MQHKTLIVMDIQNDITKNYKEIIDNVNMAIEKAIAQGMSIVYIKHNNVSEKTRTFKPDTHGEELVPELKIVSENIFTKTKASAMTCEPFMDFLTKNEINEIYMTGADATACVKSTCFNLCKAGYNVTVLSDCVTSYDKRKIEEMLGYYKDQGCKIIGVTEF